MERFVLCLIIVAVATVQCRPLTGDELDRINDECEAETRVSPSARKLVMETAILPDDDPIYRDFMACSYRKQGYLNENGDIQYDVIMEFLLQFYDKITLEPIIKLCRQYEQGKTPPEKAYLAGQCLIQELLKAEEE